jgi:protocatechuate 3,4-dioxygenase beta subunit
MQRRRFIKDTAFTAMAVTAAGYIRFNGTNYVGDCETTTDILGPFYRPNAPMRSDMRIKGDKGQPIILSGQVKHKDCRTSLKGATVELWHCSAEGVYDNDSPDFKYRAKTVCDENGNYSFKTVLPVPYDVGDNTTRPAHFHMLVSAPGYQTLITQLYFNGDKNIEKDPAAGSPSAKRRILDIKNDDDGNKQVLFNVSMMEKLPAEEAVINRLTGKYKKTNGKTEELYKKDGMLWIKDESSINGGYPLVYSGNNIFENYGSFESKFQFTIQSNGTVQLSYKAATWGGEKEGWEAVKEK